MAIGTQSHEMFSPRPFNNAHNVQKELEQIAELPLQNPQPPYSHLCLSRFVTNSTNARRINTYQNKVRRMSINIPWFVRNSYQRKLKSDNLKSWPPQVSRGSGGSKMSVCGPVSREDLQKVSVQIKKQARNIY